MKDLQCSGMAVKLLSLTNTPHPIGTHRHIPETCKGNLEWSDSGGAAGSHPQNLGRRDAHGPGQAGIGARAQGLGARGKGGAVVGGVCGNAASGNQQDLLGYTLNPPHKRGLFVRTGCWWLSHTCLASRAWRIKDNWFSPDRKYQEC